MIEVKDVKDNRYSVYDIYYLYKGMSPTMQEAVLKIMETCQIPDKNEAITPISEEEWMRLHCERCMHMGKTDICKGCVDCDRFIHLSLPNED